MDKKTRLIVIILFTLLVMSGLFIFQLNNDKQTLIKRYGKEIEELSKRNEQFIQQASQAEQENKRIQGRLDSLNKDLSGISSERDEWKRKYEIISQEKDKLLEKISELSEELAKKPKQEVKPTETVEPTVKEEGYWANIIKEKAALELKLNNLNGELTKVKLDFEGSKKEKSNLDLELSKLEQLKAALERQLEYNEKLASNLSHELAREIDDKQFLLEEFNKIKQENTSLRTQIKELATLKLSLEKGLTRLEEEKSSVDKRMFETEQILKQRIDDILNLKKDLEDTRLGKSDLGKTEARAVELAPIIVRAKDQSTQTAISEGQLGKTGRIVSINEENNFVIIDLGENMGAQIRDRFNVYRDSKQIATIEIIQLRKDISAADIIKKYEKIQVGDIVK